MQIFLSDKEEIHKIKHFSCERPLYFRILRQYHLKAQMNALHCEAFRRYYQWSKLKCIVRKDIIGASMQTDQAVVHLYHLDYLVENW